MELKVDLDRIQDLARIIRRIDLEMEDNITGLTRDLKKLLSDTSRVYPEANVQTQIRVVEQLLQNMNKRALAVHDRLDENQKTLTKAALAYKESEERAIKRIELAQKADWDRLGRLSLTGRVNSITSLAGNQAEYTEDEVEKSLMLVNPDEVHLEHMRMLLANYCRDEGYQLFEGEIFSGTMMEVVSFRRYALGRGYDPNTFEYIPLHERSNKLRDYDEAYFERMAEYPEAVEEHYAKPARTAVKKTLLNWGSFLVDNLPFVGTAKGVVETTVGKDPITSESLSELDRSISGISIAASFFPFGRFTVKNGSKLIKRVVNTGGDVIDDIADLGRSVPDVPKKGMVEGTGQGSRLIPGSPGVVTGGNSTKLGKNMMEEMGLKRSQKWTGYQAQHIIPSEMKTNPVIQKIGMDFDNASNGVFLRIPDNDVSTMARHQGYHSVYNEVVDRALNRMDINQSVDVLQKQVSNLQKNLRYLQEKGLPLYPNQGASVELWERKLNQLMN